MIVEQGTHDELVRAGGKVIHDSTLRGMLGLRRGDQLRALVERANRLLPPEDHIQAVSFGYAMARRRAEPEVPQD